jgi:hypothetical protein
MRLEKTIQLIKHYYADNMSVGNIVGEFSKAERENAYKI